MICELYSGPDVVLGLNWCYPPANLYRSSAIVFCLPFFFVGVQFLHSLYFLIYFFSLKVCWRSFLDKKKPKKCWKVGKKKMLEMCLVFLTQLRVWYAVCVHYLWHFPIFSYRFWSKLFFEKSLRECDLANVEKGRERKGSFCSLVCSYRESAKRHWQNLHPEHLTGHRHLFHQ